MYTFLRIAGTKSANKIDGQAKKHFSVINGLKSGLLSASSRN